MSKEELGESLGEMGRAAHKFESGATRMRRKHLFAGSEYDSLHLIDRDLVVTAIVELGGACALVRHRSA
jgi:hypothetical protein